jgi:hypothetical protein
MHTALAISKGDLWLGFATAARPVLYAFLEDGHIRAANRFRMLGAEAEKVGCGFSAEVLAAEMEAARRRGEKLFIVIDTLVNYEVQRKVKDENSSLDIERLIKDLRDYCRETGSTVVLSHHFGKGQQGMRGSSALNGSTDGWIDIAPEKGGDNLFRAEPTLRDGEVEDIYYKVEHSDGRMRVYRAEKPSDDAAPSGDAEPPATEKVREVFRAAAPEDRFKKKRIIEATLLPETQARAALEWLDKRAEIARPDGPRSGYSRTDLLKPAPRMLTYEEVFPNAPARAESLGATTPTAASDVSPTPENQP